MGNTAQAIRVDEYAELIYRVYHQTAVPAANRPAFMELPVSEQDAWRMAAAQLTAVIQGEVIELMRYRAVVEVPVHTNGD